MAIKNIYHFNSNYADGDQSMTDLLGSKGANLAQMCRLGLPVPAGFTITTDVAKFFHKNNRFPDNFKNELNLAIEQLEKYSGHTFGDSIKPLLVSVRSGSKFSMPGMMDSILNLGMHSNFIANIRARKTKFWLDNYTRFLTSYKSKEIPEPYEQLIEAIKIVIKSWYSSRAIEYRNLYNIDDNENTAINIQQMVYGNMDQNSATGVLFTRSPSTGENKIFGEFIVQAQGEDIVAGTHTPQPLEQLHKLMPKVYEQLLSIGQNLELHYKDVQDIEFTIEQGKLYILQTRSAKRTVQASIKIAVNLIKEDIISEQEALLRIEPNSIDQLLHDNIDYHNSELEKISHGLPASPGAAEGIIVLSTEEAEKLALKGNVILFRSDTSPEDIKAMHIASAIVTAIGGMTSHAAVVARAMGRPCVSSAEGLIIDLNKNIVKFNGHELRTGDKIIVDGSTGSIFLGKVQMIKAELPSEFWQVLKLADKYAHLKVRANAETKDEIDTALNFGAQGVGLCRTEHMFFEDNRLALLRQLILANSKELKKIIIEKLLPYHISDFKMLFKCLKGKPINIRLLDPPLHEFLPKKDDEILRLSVNTSIALNIINERLSFLHEQNPMLGHRGCRIAISNPEIYQMQIEAIFLAASALELQEQIKSDIEIMIPFVSDVKEIIKIKEDIAHKLKELDYKPKYKIGTMIELPRAALTAAEIATEVDYFSFGTNDLTQSTYGLSRDDSGKFLKDYLINKIFINDPFVKLDSKGVGKLIKMAIASSKNIKSALKFGACGEHGADPESIELLQSYGLDYISVSPYKIPIAKIAAAIANIKQKKEKHI